MTQQAHVAQAAVLQQQNGFGGIAGYGYQPGAAFAGMNAGMNMGMNGMSQVAQGKQKAQEPMPQFDEAAFEQAFAQVDQDIMAETAGDNVQATGDAEQEEHIARRELEMGQESGNEDPALQRLRENRPGENHPLNYNLCCMRLTNGVKLSTQH